MRRVALTACFAVREQVWSALAENVTNVQATVHKSHGTE